MACISLKRRFSIMTDTTDRDFIRSLARFIADGLGKQVPLEAISTFVLACENAVSVLVFAAHDLCVLDPEAATVEAVSDVLGAFVKEIRSSVQAIPEAKRPCG
jgi:hypothetical protein